MKKFISIILFLVSSIAFGADNLIGSGSQWQLVDNAGARWNAAVAYTTNGSGDVYTLGGLSAAGDNYYGDNVSGNHLLLANDGKKWGLNVFYTTDGHGNVVPISAGGGGGAAWGAITGTLSAQTDLQTALNAKANTSSLATVATSGAYADLSGKPTIPTAVSQLTNDSAFVNAAGAAAAAPVQSVFGRTGAVVAGSSDYTTSLVSEGSNLYFTNARAQAAVSATLPLVDTAGVFTINAFGGDSGTGGSAGAVPAPAAVSAEQGFMLGAGGSFTANDTQKPNNAPFQLTAQAQPVSGNQKMLNALIVQNGASTYAVVAGGTTKTVTIYNVTDQAQPQLRGSITIAGSYGACGSNASWPYVYIPASGGRTLTVLNISNPNNPVVTGTYSWAANTTSIYGCAYYNGLVFMAGQSRGLGILDVGNGVSGGTPALPVLAFDEGGTAECSVANSCKSFGVAVDGANSIAYVTTFSTATPWTYRELKAYSFASSITAPTLLQDLAMPAGAKPLGVTLNLGTKTAFVTDANATVIDVVDLTNVSTGGMSNLSTMAPTGGRTFNSELAAIVASGSNYVYIPGGGNAVQGGIDMYDLTNRSAPKWVAAVLDPLANNVFGSGVIDPRGGYIYIGSYGTGTAGSALDIFSMPFEKSTVGTGSISQLTIKNIFQLPVQASGVTPTCAAAADSGKLTLTNGLILCVCNGATPAWVTASTGTVACTF